MNDARKITHETRTGDRAWAIAWVIADGRGCNSPSARFFSAMNDRRYEILIDGELLVDPISQLTADVTVVSEYNCITDYLETLRPGDMDIPPTGRPMISARGGVMRAEERRGGKECDRTFRSRWSPTH